MELVALCDWAMPAKVGIGEIPDEGPSKCVREAGHDGNHYVHATGGRKTLLVYEVNETDQTLTEILHAQVKLPVAREEVAALVAFMELAAKRYKAPQPEGGPR